MVGDFAGLLAGCEPFEKPKEPKVCCKAMTAQCMACSLGKTMEDVCKASMARRAKMKGDKESDHPLLEGLGKMLGNFAGLLAGCEKYEPKVCCKAMTAQCMACQQNK